MARGWERDFNRAQRYLPALQRILAQYLIVEAPVLEDIQHNTDLIVVMADGVRVACRLRDQQYAGQYLGEFTLRCARPNGVRTELDKLMDGWGHYFLYGFMTPPPAADVAGWTLLDLRVFREWFRTFPPDLLPGELRHNRDGSSSFRAFRFANLPFECVVASTLPEPLLPQKRAAVAGPVQGSLFGS